ncbi:MAG: Transcriptional regulator, MarR/EmrR family [Rhodococcus erythropolis]|jgi:DNA-binding transcriptional ArsR family regulator|nr:Transcriptional regulator, MarR/EmrR family [Rhodococcus erythropolis]
MRTKGSLQLSDKGAVGESFDEVVHQRTRLSILMLLGGGVEVDFSFLRTSLDLTDGNLGRHLDVLAEAGIIAVSKTYNGRRSRSWIRLTDYGTLKLGQEARILRSIADQIDQVRALNSDETS